MVDFASHVSALTVKVGVVAGTDLEIISHNTTTGVLIFKVNKTIASGKMWSGTVTILRFKAKITGSATVNFEKQ